MAQDHLTRVEADNIFIVGGGPSVRPKALQHLMRYGYVLGVNDAALKVPCHAAFTMDGSWLEHRQQQVREMGLPLYARGKSWAKHVGMDKLHDGVTIFAQKAFRLGLSDDIQELWGDNSGHVALNFAYCCDPKRIFLFGFDFTALNGRQYFYEHYEWANTKIKSDASYADWYLSHRVASQQLRQAGIQVFNVSEISKIEDYKRIEYAELRNYL